MSNLADVRDLDCVVSFDPLVFDLTANEVTGAAAILRRILYRWITKRGTLPFDASVGIFTPITSLEATTWGPTDLAGYGASLEREAKEVDFVNDAVVAVSPTAGGKLSISGAITLVDGMTYPLEVTSDGAAFALNSIGGAA